jgi:hypothetical protein
MSASDLLSDVSAKVLNSIQGAHVESDEYLQTLTPLQ